MSRRRLPRTLFITTAAALTLIGASDASAQRITEPVDPVVTKPGRPVDPVDPPADPPPIVRPTTCAAPTLAQCQDPTYLDSSCGRLNKQACGELVAPIYQNEIRSIAQTTQILKPSGGADRLTSAKLLDPIAMPAKKYTFGSFSFATASQLGRTKPPYADTANLTPQHPTYEANGAAVASCQEYAYETLYDHERFVEAAETCGTNAECVYQLSLRTDTPGLKTTMLKKNGQPMSFQPVRAGAFSQLKNVFFVKRTEELRNHPSYAASSVFRAKVEQIISHVNGTPQTTATSELAWHRQMHDAFIASPVPAAELASIKQRTTRYSDIEGQIGVANFAIPLLEAVIPGQSGEARANSEALLAQYKAQKARAILDQATVLFAEWDHVSATDGVTLDRGCLSRTSIACDWSPQRFVSRYASHYSHETEKLFNACVEATAGNFSKVPSSYLANTDTLKTWIEAQALPKLGAQTVGERVADGDEWGDRQWFAAGYSYDAGWSITAERQQTTNRICKLKGNAYATANANAWALNQQISVLDTHHKLSVRESNNAIVFHSHLRMLGEDVYSPLDFSWTVKSATPVDKQYTKTLAERTYTKWLTVAGVGVKLQAKVELKAGADLKAYATAETQCNPDNLAYDAGITVRPWIKTHVVPEASVGIGILQAGVRGDVDLLEVSTPATGSVKLVGGVNDVTLQLRASSVVNLDALDGKLSVFLESCFPFVGCSDLASKQIYSWTGYHWQVPVFAYSKDVKINVFDAATQPSGTGPGGVILNPPVMGTFTRL
ncbi:MAG: hypothetical protein KF819_26425 [Labilithrix sp.]|nr:hypothetical protein [Labilithrix sp.]